MLFGVSRSRSCSRDCREHDDGVIAERGHGFKGHVAGALDGPFIALLHEYEIAQGRSGKRMIIDLKPTLIRTHR